jgi:hypothetical protein
MMLPPTRDARHFFLFAIVMHHGALVVAHCGKPLAVSVPGMDLSYIKALFIME